MKKIFLPLFVAAAALNAQCYDSERCLPPISGEDHLFPRCKSFFGSVEFLYWTLKEGDLSYAIDNSANDDFYSPTVAQFAHGQVKNGHFEFRPGARASVGYYNAPNFWEITAEYTYYKTHGRDCTQGCSNPNRPLSSTLPLNLPTSTRFLGLDSAECQTKFKYQLGDLFVTRVFDPNPHLRMRFISGIAAAYLRHELNNEYKLDSFARFINDHWQYKAGGLRLGVTADWWLHWQNLYLTGKATLAGFIGSYKNVFTVDSRQARLGLIDYKDTRFAEHIQLLVGPSWQSTCKCFYYSLLVGYEMNAWFNLQQTAFTHNFPTPYYQPLLWNTSTMALHGLTIRLNGGF